MSPPHPQKTPSSDARPHVAPVTEGRSTLIAASLQLMTRRGLLERYRAHVDATYRDAIFAVVPGTWVPIELIVAHYTACDKLGFSTSELVELGRGLSKRLHRPMFEVVLRLAGVAGVTPWTLAGQLPRGWARTFRGGATSSERIGPNEARVDIFGLACARITFCRVACRGLLLGGVELVAKHGYVMEVPSLCDDMNLAYRVRWE